MDSPTSVSIDWQSSSIALAQFQKLQDAARQTTALLRTLGRQQVGDAAQAGGMRVDAERNAQRQAEQMSRDSLAIQKQLVREFTSFYQSNLAQQTHGYEQQLEQRSKAWEKFARLQQAAEKSAKVIEAGGQIKAAWKERVEGLKEYTEAAMKLSAAQDRFRVLGFSDAENQKGLRSIQQTVDSIGGLKLSETTDLFTNLTGTLGGVSEAAEILPMAAKYVYANQALNPGRFTSEQLQENANQIAKFLELTGVKEEGKRHEVFDLISKVGASSQNEITPSDFVAMAIGAPGAIKELTTAGLYHLARTIPLVGNAMNFGTDLEKLIQGLSTGALDTSPKSRQGFHRLGLLDDKGGVIGAGLMRSDPLSFAESLRDHMNAHGIDTSDLTQLNNELSQLFSDQAARILPRVLIQNHDDILNRTASDSRALGVDQTAELARNSPAGKVLQFEAEMEKFKTSVGMPLVAAGMRLAEAWMPTIKALTDFFTSRPMAAEMALNVMAASKASMALAQSLAVLKTSGIAQWFQGAGDGATKLPAGVEQAGAPAVSAGRTLGSKIGVAITTSIGLTLAAFAIERIVQSWGKRAQDEADRVRAIASRRTLENQRAQQEAAGRRFTSISGLPPIAEADRRLGANLVETEGLLNSKDGLFDIFTKHDFDARLKLLTRGYWDSINSTAGGVGIGDANRLLGGSSLNIGTAGLATGIAATLVPGASSEYLKQGLREQLRSYNFRSADEMIGFFDRLRDSGKYTEREMDIVQSLAQDVYPRMTSEMEAIERTGPGAAQGLQQVRVSLADLFSSSPGSGLPGGPIIAAPGKTTATEPDSTPHRASGGYVRRSGLVYIHSGETIVPASVTKEYRHADLGIGRGSIAYQPTYHFHGAQNVSEVRQELSKHEQRVRAIIENRRRDLDLTA